LMEGN
jgi:hypothetical protein